MPTSSASRAVPWLVLGVLTGCDDGRSSAPPSVPSVQGLSVQTNSANALSTLVTFSSRNADSGRVIYWKSGGDRDSTPFAPLAGDGAAIAVLGLSSGTTYYHVLDLVGPGGRIRSDSLPAASGSIPVELQQIALTAAEPWQGGGYLLTGVGLLGASSYVVALDSAGQVRWYRQLEPGLSVGEVKQQPNGHFTAYVGQSSGWQPTYGRYFEFAPGGETVAEYSAALPYYTDNHELLMTVGPDGASRVHLFGYDLRVVDLSVFGGSTTALVAGHSILRQTASGTSEFLWSAWDHLVLADWIEEPASLKLLANIDFDHPNSLDIDTDGNYIASFRGTAEILKINSRTGETIWRLGGRNNQFTFVNDPLNGFSGQHSARVLPGGHLLLYDNGWRHTPSESRAVEYAIDPVALTATMVWEFRHTPAIFTGFTGSVQRLENGNTLVGFAAVGHVTEARPDGSVAWEGDVTVNGQPFGGYRLLRIASLYGYHKP